MFDICKMGRYTLEQNWEILKTYFQSNESLTQTVRNLRGKFSEKDLPSVQFVRQFVKRVHENGSLLDKATRARSRPVRSTETIAAVAQSIEEHPSTSTRHRARELKLSRTTLRRILSKDLNMKVCQIESTQEISEGTHTTIDQIKTEAQETHDQTTSSIATDGHNAELSLIPIQLLIQNNQLDKQ